MVVAVTFLLERAEAVKQLLLLREPAQFSVLRRGAVTWGIFRRVCPPVMGPATAERS